MIGVGGLKYLQLRVLDIYKQIKSYLPAIGYNTAIYKEKACVILKTIPILPISY